MPDADEVLAELRAANAAKTAPDTDETAESVALPDAEEAWEQLEEDQPLEVTYQGRTFAIPPADAITGRRASLHVNVSTRVLSGHQLGDKQREQILSDAEEEDLYAALLGPLWDELMQPGSGVSWSVVKHLGTTALVWAAYDRASAARYWRDGIAPKAQLTPRPPRQPQDHKGTGNKTRKRASGTSTTRKK